MISSGFESNSEAYTQYFKELPGKVEDASRFGAGRAMLMLVNLIQTQEPTPYHDTGWGKRSMVIVVNGEVKDRGAWQQAKSQAIAAAEALDRGDKVSAIRASEIPTDLGGAAYNVVVGEVIMTAFYMVYLDAGIEAEGSERKSHGLGKKSARASEQAGGRVGRGFFSTKPVRFMQKITEAYAQGVDIYLTANGGLS